MLLGLVGHPLKHSLSPIMQNIAMEKLRIKGRYHLFDVEEDELKACVEGLKAINVRGFNVTIPYKTKIIGFLDEITPRAKEIGAVNLVSLVGSGPNKRFVGDNSDAPGFIRSLIEAGFNPEGKRALVIGNGGAARAVSVGLRDSHCEVIVTSRQKPKHEFWQQFDWLELRADLVVSVDLVVDCTPVGMYPETDTPPVVDPRLYSKNTYFCDLVYNPLKTTLIKIAEATSHKVITGDGMLLYQGAISFERWFLQEAPIIEMQNILLQHLEGGK